MQSLKKLDEIAQRYVDLADSGLRPARMRREQDRVIEDLYSALRASISKLAKRKGLLTCQEDVEQHSRIAINTALESWNPEASSFSTYVHWKLRAELKTLELHIFPERRALAKDLDIKAFSLDDLSVHTKDEGSQSYLDIVNFAPELETDVEAGAERLLLFRRLDEVFASIVAPKIEAFERGGYVNIRPVMTAMRNVHIFIQRKLMDQTNNTIAVAHGLTRERVRQITGAIEKTFFTTFEIHGGIDISADDERRWFHAAAIYAEQAGQDIRLIKEADLLQSSEYETAAPIGEAPNFEFDVDVDVDVEEEFEAPEPVADERFALEAVQQDLFRETATVCRIDRNTKQVPAVRKRSSFKAGAIVLAAVTALAGQAAAAKAPAAPVPDEVSFAVKLDVRAPLDQLMEAADKVRSDNIEFSDLKAAYVPDGATQQGNLAFAPLAWLDAERICSKIRTSGENCTIVHIRFSSG